MKNRKQIISGILLIVGVVVLINILSVNYFIRLDFTADKQYTLGKVTKDILKKMKEPVTITVYFSKDVPPQIMQARRDFKDILVEYSNRSNHKVAYEFIDPAGNEEIEQKAIQAGVQPRVVNMREKDQMKQQKVFIGAVIQMGERKEVIPVILPGAAMEYDLTMAIKKLSVIDKPSIGFLQGHREPSLSGIPQAYTGMSVLYNVEPVYLNDTSYFLNKYKTLAIIAPKDSFPASHLSQIEKYLSEGGNLLIALDRVDINPQNNATFVVNTGIENWLKTKGISVDENFVVDQQCGQVTVQVGQGAYQIIPFHYILSITNFADHTITKGLENIVIPFASTITFTGDKTRTFIPLVYTSEKAGTEPAPVVFDINKEWTDSDFPLQKLPLAAAIVPKAGKEGKIVIVSDGGFVVNGEGQQQQQLQPDNVNLFVNSVDWLSDDTGLIDLRTKGITARMLDDLSDGKRSFLKYLNFLLPILLIIGYGIFRVNRNRKIRLKRMEAHYV
jgi:gliding-associated putative ABC transporter substrate-binding component GldG